MRAEVLENGVDLGRVTGGDRAAGRAALGVPADAPLVGLIGRICRQKGVDTFVEAAIQICPRVPGARFVVVGDAEDGTLTRDLRARADAAGLSDRIIFAGHLDGIADLYAALDLLAAPSRWEGFGLVLAEAMAAGVPVVASSVGGIPGVIGDAGRLVPADDVDALGHEIVSLLTDRGARERLVAAGRRQVSRFDWAASASRLAAIYAGLQGP